MQFARSCVHGAYMSPPPKGSSSIPLSCYTCATGIGAVGTAILGFQRRLTRPGTRIRGEPIRETRGRGSGQRLAPRVQSLGKLAVALPRTTPRISMTKPHDAKSWLRTRKRQRRCSSRSSHVPVAWPSDDFSHYRYTNRGDVESLFLDGRPVDYALQSHLSALSRRASRTLLCLTA